MRRTRESEKDEIQESERVCFSYVEQTPLPLQIYFIPLRFRLGIIPFCNFSPHLEDGRQQTIPKSFSPQCCCWCPAVDRDGSNGFMSALKKQMMEKGMEWPEESGHSIQVMVVWKKKLKKCSHPVTRV